MQNAAFCAFCSKYFGGIDCNIFCIFEHFNFLEGVYMRPEMKSTRNEISTHRKFQPTHLILTNKPRSFQSTCVIETGLSDFHRVTVSVLKMHFRKLPPKIISYRDYESFENERFMDSLILALNSRNIDYTKNPDVFCEVCQNELNHHAPRKRKYIRGNN